MENFTDEHQDLLSATLAAANTVDGEERSEITGAIAIEYARRDDLEKAVEVMDGVQDPYLREEGFGTLAGLAVDSGNSELADELLNTIEDPSLLTVALEQMALSHARRGDFDSALQLCNELADPSDVFAAIAVNYAAKGFYEEAVDLARSIESGLPRTLALVQIASEETTQDNPSAAEALLAEATESASEMEFPEDQIDCLVAIATAFEKLGQTDVAYERLMDALRVSEEIENGSGIMTATSVRDRQVAIIASEMANLKLFDKAVEVLETVEDPFRFALGSRDLALAYHKNQREAEATELLDQAVEITEEAEVVSEQAVSAQQEVFSSLAHAYAMNGQIEKALEVAELIHRIVVKSFCLQEIGKIAVSLGSDPSLISESFVDAPSKSSFWLVVSDAYSQLDHTEGRDKALAQALRYAEDCSDRPYEQTLALNEIAARQAAKGRMEQTTSLFQRTISTIPTIASSTRKTLVLLDMSRKYTQLGRELNDQESTLLRDVLSQLAL